MVLGSFAARSFGLVVVAGHLGVSAGIGTRSVSPVAAGFNPRSESRIAFSTACTIFFSKGVTPIVRASISVIFATWLIGVGVP